MNPRDNVVNILYDMRRKQEQRVSSIMAISILLLLLFLIAVNIFELNTAINIYGLVVILLFESCGLLYNVVTYNDTQETIKSIDAFYISTAKRVSDDARKSKKKISK